MSMKTKSAKYAKMRRGEYQSVISIRRTAPLLQTPCVLDTL